MKNAFYILLLLAFTTGCQKANDTPPPAAVAHQFGMMGGSCYDYTSSTYTAATNCAGMNSNSTYTMQNGTCVSSTGQQVATSFCTSTANNGYYTNNGVCYSSTTNQQVAANLCTSTTNNGYYMNNGVCYSSTTNQQVAANLCGTNSQLPPQMPMPMPMPPGMPMPPNYQSGGPCFGYYIYNGNGYPEYGYCYGTNCRGYMLTEVATGRMVSCQ